MYAKCKYIPNTRIINMMTQKFMNRSFVKNPQDDQAISCPVILTYGYERAPQTPQSLVLSWSLRARMRKVEREATEMWKISCHAFLRPSR